MDMIYFYLLVKRLLCCWCDGGILYMILTSQIVLHTLFSIHECKRIPEKSHSCSSYESVSHCIGDDAEVLKQLEDRTKAAKDALFRKKKELQHLSTDFEEDSRRLEQLRMQNLKIEKQKEHLLGAQSQIREEILLQNSQIDELNEKCKEKNLQLVLSSFFIFLITSFRLSCFDITKPYL
jgi:septal ring factor EnvC (AmiA/AmiB activator)